MPSQVTSVDFDDEQQLVSFVCRRIVLLQKFDVSPAYVLLNLKIADRSGLTFWQDGIVGVPADQVDTPVLLERSISAAVLLEAMRNAQFRH